MQSAPWAPRSAKQLGVPVGEITSGLLTGNGEPASVRTESGSPTGTVSSTRPPAAFGNGEAVDWNARLSVELVRTTSPRATGPVNGVSAVENDVLQKSFGDSEPAVPLMV